MKKNMLKAFGLVILATILMSSASMVYATREAVNSTATIQFDQNDLNSKGVALVGTLYILGEGKTTTLKVANVAETKVTWKSSDEKLATIENGKLIALKAGRVTITATYEGKNKEVKLFIWNAYLKDGQFWAYKTASKSSIDEVLKSKVYLVLSETSNDQAFKVEDYIFNGGSYNGTLKGKYITNYYNKKNNASTNGYYTYSFYQGIPVDKVELDKTEAKMTVDETLNLVAKISPENSANKELTWSSNNPAIATVDKNGTVKAKKAGEAIITVKTDNGKTATCKLTITVPANSIKLNQDTAPMVVGGDLLQLTAKVLPENATNKTITWSSEDNTIATVDNTGKVKAIKVGTVIITAKLDNGLSAKCMVTIIEKPKVQIRTIQMSEKASLLINGTFKLSPTISPSNADNKGITWSSSNNAVAIVDENGNITAKSAGTAIITATAKDGSGVKAECSITVYGEAKLVLNKTEVDIKKGKTFTLKTEILSSKSDKISSFKSSNTKVATVSKNGKITAKKKGTATITVKTKNGLVAKCKVTVYNNAIVIQ